MEDSFKEKTRLGQVIQSKYSYKKWGIEKDI